MGGYDAEFTYFHLTIHYNNPELTPSKRKREDYHTILISKDLRNIIIFKMYKILVE
jgi:hypothetical protein